VTSGADIRYNKTALSNGIRVVSETVPGARSVAVGLWMLSGSRDETEPAGIAHFLEHMVFKGTTRRNAYDIAVSLESLGGQLNAFTEREFTCFYAHLLGENLPEAVDVLADLVQNPRFDPPDIDNEKQVVIEEIRGLEDAPEDWVQELFLETAFDGHPLGRSVLGTMKSLRGADRDDLETFRTHHYTSDNCLVAAAGNLEHDRLVELVHNHLSGLPLKADKPPRTPARFHGAKNKTRRAPVGQAHLALGASGFPYNEPRKFALIVLNAMLAGGMSSRLFQRLREREGLAYAVYSMLDFWADAGLVSVYAGSSAENASRIQDEIHDEIDILCRDADAEGTVRTRTQVARGLELSLENTGSRMNRLAKMEAYTGRFTPIEEVIREVEAVTPEAVRETARTLLAPGGRSTVLLTA
jgi:predicted Zn-dependent peptidase